MEQCASTASLLASVREQERQFEMLSRALEEERRSCAGTLPRPLPNMQNGRIPCDADIERLTLSDGYINGTHHFRMDPGQVMQESYTVEEDPQESPPVISVETSDDGTTRRTETTVKKVVKTTTTRTVIPSVSDTMSLDGGGSMTGMGGYTTPMDRIYRQGPAGVVPMDYPTLTVPRNYQYGPPAGYEYRSGPPSETYASLTRGARMDDRFRPVHPDGYRTLDPSFRTPSRNQLDPYAAQPQVARMGSAMEVSSIPRFVPEPYGLEDDQRSIGYDEPDYGMGHPVHYSTVPRNHHAFQGPPRRTASYEGFLDSDMGGTGDLYYLGAGAPLAQGERGSLASLDSTLKKGPGPGGWRQPELSEVIAMLNYRLDPVRSNAAAYLQHLTYKNDKLKADVRRLKGIPALVSLLENPNRDVHFAACGALKNISYGKDEDNKIQIKKCDGVPALAKLLRRTSDQDLTDIITATLWNLSSHDSVKMEIVDHALHALTDEVIVPHSGWERGRNGAGGGEENCKPRHLEWETALTNSAGCLRNVSSERIEARRKLRECTGLVDSIIYIVQSQIDCKDVDNKLIENCVCLLRNLSYHVHDEIPNHERYKETMAVNQGTAPSGNKGRRFSSRRGKGRKDDEASEALIDISKRTSAKGYELLYQREVVHIYTSLLKETTNPIVLEASAGALQNLCAGYWTYGRYIRGLMGQENRLHKLVALLAHGNDRVVRAMSGALRNLAIDLSNRNQLGRDAVPHLVANLPCDAQSQPMRALSEKTVLSILSTLHEIVGSDLEAAKTLISSQGIKRLVDIKDGKISNCSEREVRGAGLLLQTVWGHKELRRSLEKEGWKKNVFMVNSNPPNNNNRTNGSHEESTLPLIEKGSRNNREDIPMDDLGPDAYSTLDQRGKRNNLENPLGPADKDAAQGGMYGEKQASLPLMDSYDG